MERASSWKVFKLKSLNLKSFCLSWKEPGEVGKNRAKLRKILRSRKETRIARLKNRYPTSLCFSKFNFQLHLLLSNFATNFPTASRAFQPLFFQFHFRPSNLKLSNFLLFSTALSNYTYPEFHVRSLDILTIKVC